MDPVRRSGRRRAFPDPLAGAHARAWRPRSQPLVAADASGPGAGSDDGRRGDRPQGQGDPAPQREAGRLEPEGARRSTSPTARSGRSHDKPKSGWFDVAFAGRPGLTFGYRAASFGEDGGPLELAYALTVHKAQGSDFGIVFFVLPKTRLLSRELLYTGLTRSKEKLVLLVEGDDASGLYELTLPARVGDGASQHQPVPRGRARGRGEDALRAST